MTVEQLITKLSEATDGEFLSFDQVIKIDCCGLYLIYQDEKIIYVGKTGRTGKMRMRELAADYRSHTLNRKLLHSILNIHLGQVLPPLNKESKHKLITAGIVSENDFLRMQAQINLQVRN